MKKQLLVNIIYTPGSVRYVGHFILSLLKFTDFSYRLVSNGCSLSERGELHLVCDKFERLVYFNFPSAHMENHGRVLDYLLILDDDKFFCFMDSDIFANAKIQDIVGILNENSLTALFSAMPLWVKKSEYQFEREFRDLNGTFNKLWNGTCVGVTYFALYNRKELIDLTQSYALGFSEIMWAEIKPKIQQLLVDNKLAKVNFDTGKLINVLLSLENKSLRNIELANLCHIGGISFEGIHSETSNSDRAKSKVKLRTFLIDKFEFLVKVRREYVFNRRQNYSSIKERRFNYNQRNLHRNVTRKYFHNLFDSLVEENELPAVPKTDDVEIQENLRIGQEAYIKNFFEFYKKYE